MPELPSGAVTFLFTDIEGSTRLVKQLRERWSDVLADHQRLLREAFANHRGYEVDTQGDSFFVAFASARDSVLAAAEGQLALGSHRWPDGADVKVRMGIHTGQALASDGRYTGLAVHRAARIGAAAHGGQILVSQATQTLLEDEEEDLHIFLRDLGNRRLKDLDRPVRLYQLAADGLPTEFPPLRHQVQDSVSIRRRRIALAAIGLVLIAAAVSAAAIFRTWSSGAITVRSNAVGIIDPKTNKVVGQVAVGIRPDAVVGGANSVWVANDEDRTVSRIDSRTRVLIRTIPVSQTPTGLAFGSGAVWVSHGLTGTVSRIDPAFATVKTVRVTHAFAGGGLAGTVATAAGAVWTAWGDSTVARLDPASAKVLGAAIAGRSPSAIAYGEGSFWVANRGDNTVSQMSLNTGRQTNVFHVGSGPSAIVVGGGKVWVADSVDDSVTRIDPFSGSFATIPVGDGPAGIAFGAGAVWVANARDGTISRIDPTTHNVRTIHVGNSPVGVVVDLGRVWVSVEAR
jgi:YVTN family beta-propeller protein